MKISDLPKKISIFPLNNFIIFPKTTVPLNIFEPRYLEMIDNSMNSNKLIGMIQPKRKNNDQNMPELHNIGCLGKIVGFNETNDGRYMIELNGLIRFQITREIQSNSKYRECEINFKDYHHDLSRAKDEIKISDLELIFKDLKSLFKNRGLIINWKSLEKQNLDETLNALAMASPFTLEEKQILLEAKDLNIRKNKITEILNTYSNDIFENTTLQ